MNHLWNAKINGKCGKGNVKYAYTIQYHDLTYRLDVVEASFVKLKIATQKQSKIGPNMAPSTPRKYIPPATESPVKYSWPPLKQSECMFINKSITVSDRRDSEQVTHSLTSALIAGSTKLDGNTKWISTKIMPSIKRSCMSHKSKKAGMLHQ